MYITHSLNTFGSGEDRNEMNSENKHEPLKSDYRCNLLYTMQQKGKLIIKMQSHISNGIDFSAYSWFSVCEENERMDVPVENTFVIILDRH